MQPTKDLVDAIDRDRIRWAREIPMEERPWLGIRLFDEACELAKTGIRMRFPDADEERVMRILQERLAIVQRLEERGIYHPAENEDG